ncbi:MAG: hypothetical protein ACI8PD_001070, partial [Nitrospinales bacterium]
YIQERKLNVSGTLLLRQNKKYSTTHWYIITPPFSYFSSRLETSTYPFSKM